MHISPADRSRRPTTWLRLSSLAAVAGLVSLLGAVLTAASPVASTPSPAMPKPRPEPRQVMDSRGRAALWIDVDDCRAFSASPEARSLQARLVASWPSILPPPMTSGVCLGQRYVAFQGRPGEVHQELAHRASAAPGQDREAGHARAR